MPPKGFCQFFDTNGGRQTATHHTIFAPRKQHLFFAHRHAIFSHLDLVRLIKRLYIWTTKKHQSTHLTIHPVQPTRIMKKNKKKDIGYQSLQAFKKARREEEIQAHGKSINYASVTKDKTKYTRKEKHKKRLNGDD